MVESMKKLCALSLAVFIATAAFAFDGGEVLYEFKFNHSLEDFTDQSAISSAPWRHSSEYLIDFSRTDFPYRDAGFIIIDSEDYGHTAIDASMQTPVLSISRNIGDLLLLEFDHYFKQIGDETARVEISLDNGQEWKSAGEYSGRTYFGRDIIHLNPFLHRGANEVLIRFHYFNANYTWFWAVDNVRITRIPSANIVAGPHFSTSDFASKLVLRPPGPPAGRNTCYAVDYEMILINHNVSENDIEMDFRASFNYLPGSSEKSVNSPGMFAADKSLISAAPGYYNSAALKWDRERYYAIGGGGFINATIYNLGNQPDALLSYYIIIRYEPKVISELTK